eukprot:10661945-Karenia_brevis.AAC.1
MMGSNDAATAQAPVAERPQSSPWQGHGKDIEKPNKADKKKQHIKTSIQNASLAALEHFCILKGLEHK